jgi:DNA-binding beta-propeller fold protein YncE
MVIDMASRTATAKLPIVSAGNGIAFAPGDTLLYISSMFGGISVVNTKTNTVIRTIQLFGTLQDVAISKDGTELYVAREDVRAIEVLALPAGTRTTSITVSAPVFGLSLTPDGAQLWAAHTATGVVSIIDRAERTVVRALFVAGSPRRIAFDRLGTLAVVSNEWGGVHLIR